jgi:hypothetical protein
MLLGRLIKEALQGQARFVAELHAHDAPLAQKLAEGAARREMTPEAYLAQALQDFLAEDDDEAWTTVTSALQGDAAPGPAFLAAVVRRRLRLDGVPEAADA